MSALLDSLHASFAALPAVRIDADGLGDARRAAMALALAEGLPSQRDERWKYTALRALSARSFAGPGGLPGVAAELLTIAGTPSPAMDDKYCRVCSVGLWNPRIQQSMATAQRPSVKDRRAADAHKPGDTGRKSMSSAKRRLQSVHNSSSKNGAVMTVGPASNVKPSCLYT